MVDSEWLRNLAGATLQGGRLTAPDPEAVRRLAEARVAAAIVGLEDEAREAAEVHNSHGKRHVRVLSLTEPGPGAGFTMLLGKAQVTLSYMPYSLSATLTVMRSFRRKTVELCRLGPHVDPFGSVAWRAGNDLIMTNELIMKKLFEDLTRAALETDGGLEGP